MIEFALDIIHNKKSGIILAPRGSGKTTVLNTGLQSWLVAVRPDRLLIAVPAVTVGIAVIATVERCAMSC